MYKYIHIYVYGFGLFLIQKQVLNANLATVENVIFSVIPRPAKIAM